MIATTVLALFKRLPFRWYELLAIGTLVIGGLFIWYQSQQIDNLDRKKVIAEEAVAASIAIRETLIKRQQIDQTVMLDWISARDVYREEQRKIIDTTFLDYFTLPPEETTRADPPVNPSTPTATAPAPVAVPVKTMSDRQLDVLADGMWDTYCQTGVDDPGCVP